MKKKLAQEFAAKKNLIVGKESRSFEPSDEVLQNKGRSKTLDDLKIDNEEDSKADEFKSKIEIVHNNDLLDTEREFLD